MFSTATTLTPLFTLHLLISYNHFLSIAYDDLILEFKVSFLFHLTLKTIYNQKCSRGSPDFSAAHLNWIKRLHCSRHSKSSHCFAELHPSWGPAPALVLTLLHCSLLEDPLAFKTLDFAEVSPQRKKTAEPTAAVPANGVHQLAVAFAFLTCSLLIAGACIKVRSSHRLQSAARSRQGLLLGRSTERRQMLWVPVRGRASPHPAHPYPSVGWGGAAHTLKGGKTSWWWNTLLLTSGSLQPPLIAGCRGKCCQECAAHPHVPLTSAWRQCLCLAPHKMNKTEPEHLRGAPVKDLTLFSVTFELFFQMSPHTGINISWTGSSCVNIPLNNGKLTCDEVSAPSLWVTESNWFPLSPFLSIDDVPITQSTKQWYSLYHSFFCGKLPQRASEKAVQDTCISVAACSEACKVDNYNVIE